MKDILIKDFLKRQEIVVKDYQDNIAAIGREIREGEYMLYELSSNRFYIHTQTDEEFYCDDILEVIFESLEGKEVK